MELVVPAHHSNWFSLIHNNYQCMNEYMARYNGIRINLKSKIFCYVECHYDIETAPTYVPKILIDGRLLRQAQLLVGLGLPNKELAEILRNQEDLYIHPERYSYEAHM